ncbi:MAG TPA: hypothetical protein VM686_41255 [Polyangiaceae bacterium]|jgi:hypothetical protein|nr:hypothetical protein [Polyangiaceae bacterium]
MSLLAKNVAIAVFVSAGLAAPIAATVTYLQTKPSNTAPIQFPLPDPPPEPLAATIIEPEFVPVEALPLERPAPRTPTRNAVQHSQAPPRDPAKFELVLPTVERAAELGSHDAASPGARSSLMPPPLPRDTRKTLQYEEHLR